MESILKVLSRSENIKNVERFSRGDESFQRMVKFEIEGQEYIIEYFANICYLRIGKAEVVFDKVKFYGTWPNQYKENLQFYDYKDEIVCVIGVDKWPNQGGSSNDTADS